MILLRLWVVVFLLELNWYLVKRGTVLLIFSPNGHDLMCQLLVIWLQADWVIIAWAAGEDGDKAQGEAYSSSEISEPRLASLSRCERYNKLLRARLGVHPDQKTRIFRLWWSLVSSHPSLYGVSWTCALPLSIKISALSHECGSETGNYVLSRHWSRSS